jgi:uncharacterized membrane protein YfcA
MMFGLLVFVPASLVGSVIGKKVVERVPQDQFRIFVAAFIFLQDWTWLFFHEDSVRQNE